MKKSTMTSITKITINNFQLVSTGCLGNS